MKMKYEKPLVSVIMPAYNAERYIAEAIESIINQTYRDLEIIVLDDGSNDETYKIVSNYANVDSRIVVATRENRGLQFTLNELISMSSGKYIARMDADDISLPDRIEKQVYYMECHHEVAALGTYIKIKGTNNVINRPKFFLYETRKIRMMFENLGIAHPSAMLRKSSLQEANIRYNEKNVAAEDYELWWDIMNSGYVVTQLNEVLLEYRVHSSQITSAKRGVVERSISEVQLKILREIGDFEFDDVNLLSEWYFHCDSSKHDKYEELLQRIINANKSSRTFVQWILESEILFQWIARAINDYKLNHSLTMMKSSLLNKLILPNRLIYVGYELGCERCKVR